jgi:hypothetical protein
MDYREELFRSLCTIAVGCLRAFSRSRSGCSARTAGHTRSSRAALPRCFPYDRGLDTKEGFTIIDQDAFLLAGRSRRFAPSNMKDGDVVVASSVGFHRFGVKRSF